MEFVTYDARAAELYPPRPASPDWFRQTPVGTARRRFGSLRLKQETTVKGCPGVGDFLGLGWVLPLANDFVVTANDDGFAWESRASSVQGLRPVVDVFRPDQWDRCPRAANDHDWTLKLPTPWMLRTPPGWSTLVLDPWYHREERFTAFPGVVDSDRFGVMSPILVWHVPKGEPVLLKAGTPLVHLVPFRRGTLEPRVTCDQDAWRALIDQADVVAPDRLAPGSYREHARLTKEARRG